MRVERQCEACAGPGEMRGCGLVLCRYCYRVCLDEGMETFLRWFPSLRAKVETAREMAGKHMEARV